MLLLPSSQDATCLAVLEAMASGCPLVSAHTADAADLLLHGHTARLFPPHDVATCAKQLFVTLSAPAQSLLLAERAAAHVRQFYNPMQQSRQLESILEYVCQPQA
ncbi:glycosyltransferase [Hymenobacter volaticus]|uniref:Glycosyltransferase n=1 Tax=Hymenobacter volaticus TaxID=2932254 RepID=A0ABY4G0C9_9BACT|nr:glycosyltransferase [Hymenobacter volaticus]UOQ64261.1 glycosyltransferase [Hymenobacter volaticus]